MAVEDFTGTGYRGALAVPVEQSDAEYVLEFADRFRDGGLADGQGIGCLDQAFLPCDLKETLQVPVFDATVDHRISISVWLCKCAKLSFYITKLPDHSFVG
jgi:hypothetical protein